MSKINTYNKLIVIDINLDWKIDDKDYKNKDMPLVLSLFKKASQYQTVVLQTSNCLVDAIDLIKSLNIKKGYLVASGGAIIYDIAQEKILQMYTLDPDDIQTMIHHGIMNGINITLYTSDRKFMYVSNAVAYNTIKNKCYSQYEIIDNYDLLQKTLSRTDIVDIGYLYLLGSSNNSKQDKFLSNLEKFWENEVSSISIKSNKTSDFVHVGHKDATKLKGIQYIMGLTNVGHLSDVLYVGASIVNNECYITFKNSLITSNSDFINEIGSKNKHKFIATEINNLDPEFGLHSNSFWK